MDLGLGGRVALVGGSSAGLGRAIAARLAAEGARVAVNGRDAVGATPLGRRGEPEELVSVVAFLASERASYITGAVLAVDGGRLRSID